MVMTLSSVLLDRHRSLGSSIFKASMVMMYQCNGDQKRGWIGVGDGLLLSGTSMLNTLHPDNDMRNSKAPDPLAIGTWLIV